MFEAGLFEVKNEGVVSCVRITSLDALASCSVQEGLSLSWFMSTEA
jgi:hypothetical protein